MKASDRTTLTFPFLILIFLCATVPFVPALNAGFVNWDDTYLVTANSAIRAFAPSVVWGWFTSFYVDHYHPLVMFSFALDHAIAGYNPLMFHLTNILIHGMNALLVLMLLRHFVKDRLALILAVALFAMHPLRVEAVAWVSARKDLLSTFFILVSVLSFIRYREGHRSSLLLISFLAALLASFSKAVAFVIPVLMAATMLTGTKRKTKHELRVLAPFFGLAVFVAVVAIVAQYSTDITDYDPQYSLLRGITVPFWNIVFYSWKTALPYGLSAVYPFPENGGPDLLARSLVSLVVVSVLVIAILLARPEKRIMFALSWIIVCLLPVLQWIPVGRAFAADRYTYLPAVGLSLLVAVFLERAVHVKGGAYRPVVRRAGIIIMATLGTVAGIRAEVWKSSRILWLDVLESYPGYAEGYVYLGSALATEEGNTRDAMEAFSEAIRLDDRNPSAFANRALASYRSAAPDTSRIISDLTSAIALSPEPLRHEVFLAEVYHEYGMTDRAFAMCSALLDANPSLHTLRLLRLKCAYELDRPEIVREDIAYLKSAGIDVSIEQQEQSKR